MAIVYKADLQPTKSELISDWLPRQPWLDTGDQELAPVASFRFDDPAGEVGLETHLVAADTLIAHVPLTYRDTPLTTANPGLLGTMHHSVLGTRWIYDAAWDPLYWTLLSGAILHGRPQADQYVVEGEEVHLMDEAVHLSASGSINAAAPEFDDVSPVTDGISTTVTADRLSVSITRRVGALLQCDAALTATWPGQETPVQIATAAPNDRPPDVW